MSKSNVITTRELSDASCQAQAESFLAYSKRGRLSFDDWAETKGFAPGDLALIRRAWLLLLDEEVFG